MTKYRVYESASDLDVVFACNLSTTDMGARAGGQSLEEELGLPKEWIKAGALIYVESARVELHFPAKLLLSGELDDDISVVHALDRWLRHLLGECGSLSFIEVSGEEISAGGATFWVDVFRIIHDHVDSDIDDSVMRSAVGRLSG